MIAMKYISCTRPICNISKFKAALQVVGTLRPSHLKLNLTSLCSSNTWRRSFYSTTADQVQVLIGKDKGRHGLVNFIIKERNWCYVEGLNCEYKLEEEFEGQPLLKKTEKPLLVTSEVRLVDPADNEPTDIEWKYTEDGNKVRVSVRSGRILPLPAAAEDYYDDFTQISSYKDGDKDTNKEELQRVTFEPSLKSFEQDIFDQMGIKEDRKPGKTYWY